MTVLLVILGLLAVFFLTMNLWTRRLTRQGHELVPQLGQIVPVKGGSIHYIEKGDPTNPTLVMIHGLSGQLQHFTYALVDDLAREYHVIAVDRPGCGYSTRNSAQLATLPEQARMIHEFLMSKGVECAVLVGHSLGGAVALAMALNYPDKIRALALLSPLTQEMSGAPVVFKPLEIRTEWLRNFIGYTIAVPMARKTAPMVLQDVFAPEPAPEDFLYRAGGALGLRPSAFITASQDVIGIETSIHDLCHRYKELQVPGGILFGSEDPILSATQHGTPMTKFGLSLEVLENRGHMILITVPELCSDFIRRIVEATAADTPNTKA